jgi:hypothetical protein
VVVALPVLLAVPMALNVLIDRPEALIPLPMTPATARRARVVS